MLLHLWQFENARNDMRKRMPIKPRVRAAQAGETQPARCRSNEVGRLWPWSEVTGIEVLKVKVQSGMRK